MNGGRPPRNAPRERGLVAGVVAVVAAAYVVLRFVVPWISVWLGASAVPAPVPAFLLTLYMAWVGLGVLVYLSSSQRRWRTFLTPFVRLLAGTGRHVTAARRTFLVVAPVVVGWATWTEVRPGFERPPTFRRQHPTMPSEYVDRRNPHRDGEADVLRAAVGEGIVLYQKNCRPCHGAKADGQGPLARGLRLRPVDFRDPGTIATLVEQYAFWRVNEGALGLPEVATPWNSAMPGWEGELEADQLWKIILAEYRISGTEPRKPEER